MTQPSRTPAPPARSPATSESGTGSGPAATAPRAPTGPLSAARLLGNGAVGDAVPGTLRGTPLPASDLARFSAAFGADLRDVRINTGDQAAALARSRGALAYTAGSDVVLGSGYLPGSRHSQLLLAHELAHVVQQRAGRAGAPTVGDDVRSEAEADDAAILATSGRLVGRPSAVAGTGIGPAWSPLHPAGVAVQCKADATAGVLPPQPAEESAWATYEGPTAKYFLVHDVQWHVDRIFGDLDLVVAGGQTRRRTLSSAQLARICVEILARGTNLPLQGGGLELVEHVRTVIDDYGLKDVRVFVIPVPLSLVRRQFEPAAFEAYWSTVTQGGDLTAAHEAMVASGGLASGGLATGTSSGTGAGPAGAAGRGQTPPGWVHDRYEGLQQLLRGGRRAPEPPRDLPDRVVLWHDERDDSWHLNVWTSVDPAGKQKVAQSIRLRPGESEEDLYQRVRDATVRGLQRDEDRRREEQAQRLAPAWALTLERQVRARLDAARARQGRARDLPDGLILGPGPDVQLHVWVERGSGTTTQRNSGSVPLVPAATVEQVVAYVRHLSAILREFEQRPLTEAPRPDAPPDPADEGALEAFPVRLVPVDLRPDNVTVTGARNEFHAELDYAARYDVAGQFADLTIASKLYQQSIRFYWQVYPVPAGVPVPEGQEQAPAEWGPRWEWLFDRFNPPADEQGRPQPRTVRVEGEPVTGTDSSDSTSRVPMPDEPGDYLVRLVTGHAPIGESKLRRRPSEAYYPVQVRPLDTEVGQAASRRLSRITALEDELSTADRLLAGSDLDDRQRRELLATREFDAADLPRLRRKEAQSLTQSTAEEIAHATELLHRVQRLVDVLPGLVGRAKAEHVAPSTLLAPTPDLETVYWYVIARGTSPRGFAEQLQREIGQLQQVQRLAADFADEIKGSSPYQYSPETAFGSEVTGQVHPLVMMLGEAPDRTRILLASQRGGIAAEVAGEGVAYALVDVTDPQTKKVYYGYSRRSGREGHREAIDDAYRQFGEDATYGKGLIATRIPPGPAGAADMHPGSEIRTYRSKEGIVQRVLWALGVIAAVAGLAALVMTGVGATAAAGIVGAIAATAGAITALHNISERQRRHSLEFDAELLLDVLAVVGAVPALVGARAVVRTAAGLRVAVVTQRFLKIYSAAEIAATVVLVPTKLYQDIQRIETDTTLSLEQRRLMVAQARLGAVQSGVMLLGSVAAAHAGGKGTGEPARPETGVLGEDPPSLREQIDILELEGFGKYESMYERGWVDQHGNWTAQAPEIVRQAARVPATEPGVGTSAGGGTAAPPGGTAAPPGGGGGGRPPATVYTHELGLQPVQPPGSVETSRRGPVGTPEVSAQPSAPRRRVEEAPRSEGSTRQEIREHVREETGEEGRSVSDVEGHTLEEAAALGQEILGEGGRLDHLEAHHPVEVFLLRAIQARRVGRAAGTVRAQGGEGFRQVVDVLFPQGDPAQAEFGGLVPLEKLRHDELHRALNDTLDVMLEPERVADLRERRGPPPTFGPGSRVVQGEGAAGMMRRLQALTENELLNLLEQAYTTVQREHPGLLNQREWAAVHQAFDRIREQF
jgi:uncharacterized membrane protein HdeD (DUF308 family)